MTKYEVKSSKASLNWMVSLHHTGLNDILAHEMACILLGLVTPTESSP
jgi:hypothetical protein